VCVTVLAHGAPTAGFEQNLGASLPLQTQFIDERGRAGILGDYFGDTPVVMVFGYYHCPRLCSTLMDGVLQVLAEAGLPHAIVAIGIDPRETAQDAARKLAVYRTIDGDDTDGLHLLTGQRAQISSVAHAAGFRYQYDQDSDQYTHPAGFLIATPDGRISRYFFGLRFDRRDIRLALIEASGQRIGTLTERVQLFCSHYDPLTGRYTVAVMTGIRIFTALILALLAMGVWIAHRRRQRRLRAPMPDRDGAHDVAPDPAGGPP
jgi:protein SCO1/2